MIKAKGFGLTFFNSMMKQLEGSFTVESNHGTKQILIIKNINFFIALTSQMP
jgi:two-component sensor histidine kinase